MESKSLMRETSKQLVEMRMKSLEDEMAFVKNELTEGDDDVK